MDWTWILLDVIDVRSFSSLWYWILVAVLWTAVTQRVLGVPVDMLARARRDGGQAQADLEDMVRINVGRLLDTVHAAGLWLAGIAAFVLTGLVVLAAWYGVELAQALLFIVVPMAVVGALALAAARRLAAEGPRGDDLLRRLRRHRAQVQAVGIAAVFLTALFGMYRNLAALQGWP